MAETTGIPSSREEDSPASGGRTPSESSPRNHTVQRDLKPAETGTDRRSVRPILDHGLDQAGPKSFGSLTCRIPLICPPAHEVRSMSSGDEVGADQTDGEGVDRPGVVGS